MKKPEVCIDLWQEVLANDDSNAEALGALAGLYERAKDFEKLAAVLERQAEVTYDAAGEDPGPHASSATIYGERLNNDEGAVNAWRALLTLDPNDRRAQDALKKKYLALGRWDDLEVFYAESGKWDEFIRVLEQQEAKETEPAGEDLAPLQDRPALGRQEAEARSRREGLREGPRARADNLQAAEALIPIYTAANNAKALANAIEVKLGHEQDPAAKLELYREVAALYEGKVKDPQKAFDRYLAAFELAPGDERTSEDVERAAKATGALGRGRRGLPARDRRRPTRAAIATSAIMLRLRLGRVLVDEPAARSTRRSRRTAPSTTPTARTPRRIAALERLYRQTSRFAELLGIYEKKRDLVDDARREEGDQLRDRASSTRTRSRTSTSAIETYVQVLEDEPSDAQALAALDVLYGRLGRWEPYVDVLRRRIELDVGEARARRSQVPPRARRSRSTSATPPARSRTTARSSSSTPQHEGARRRSRRCSRATCAPRPRRSSSRSTRSAATGRS